MAMAVMTVMVVRCSGPAGGVVVVRLHVGEGWQQVGEPVGVQQARREG